MAFRRVLLAASLKTWYPEQRTISPYFQANLNRPCLAAQRRFLVTKREPVYVERMEPSLIAVVQMTSGNDKEKNMQLCNSLITQASEKKAKMVFLPEAFDYIGAGREETAQLAETLDGAVVSNYRDVAKRLGIWLSLGGFHLRPDSCSKSPHISNVHLIINSSGDIVAKYSKMHLFDVKIPEKNVDLRESSTVKAGEEIVPPVPTPVGNIGLAICYDLRFPEFSDRLRRDGAQILTYPSAFTVPTGEAHWEPLLRARAIENQCYVVAAAQVGSHNAKRTSYGHSVIINPWGKILAEAEPSEQLIYGEIDLNFLEQTRKEMPVLEHKRLDAAGLRRQYYIPHDDEGEELFEFGQANVKRKIIFLESRFARAFVNKKCILPGHVLVITKRKATRFHLLTEEEVTDLSLLVQKVEIVVRHIQGSTSANIACQDGPDSGQSIAHIHIHVLPRRAGDFKRTDQVHEELERYEHDSEPQKWRTEEEMVEECNHIRSVIRNNFSSFLTS